MRNLIDILDFSVEEIDGLINTATDIIADPKKYANACQGQILGTLFFEPSTRTRLSFTSAMMSLGGNVLGFSEANSSSAEQEPNQRLPCRRRLVRKTPTLVSTRP